MVGEPIVGDFNGDGLDDLGAFADDTFRISLAGTPGGVGPLSWSTTLVTFRFGYIGVRERPVAADMNKDGIDDIGLWVPDRSGVTPEEGSEWYFLVSGGDNFTPGAGPGGFASEVGDGVPDTVLDRIVLGDDPVFGAPAAGPVVEFRPVPFGNDIYALFGDEFALPVVGNFDPPVTSGATGGTGPITGTNPANAFDVDADGDVDRDDALLIIAELRRNGSHAFRSPQLSNSGRLLYLDVTGDGTVDANDALRVIGVLRGRDNIATGGEGEAADAAFGTASNRAEGESASDASLASTTVIVASRQPAETNAPLAAATGTTLAAITNSPAVSPSSSVSGQDAQLDGTLAGVGSLIVALDQPSGGTASPSAKAQTGASSSDSSAVDAALAQLFDLAQPSAWAASTADTETAELDFILADIANDVAAARTDERDEDKLLAELA
jgi:hypothetical protein